MKLYQKLGKRTFDIVCSFFSFSLLSPVFILISLLIIIDSRGNPFFVQKRIGKAMKPFRLVKFRSMIPTRNCLEKEFDPGGVGRVTRTGKILRFSKFDELPELFNIIMGDMSFIGPRPEVEKYVSAFSEDYKMVLEVRPGLSDFASIKYRNEESLLSRQDDPEAYYTAVILPDKIQHAKIYLSKIGFRTDVKLIVDTLKSLFISPSNRQVCGK
jgi:lipopolysaccharide/colanic/teichoic acid biosynthesis glycosyltransferase